VAFRDVAELDHPCQPEQADEQRADDGSQQQGDGERQVTVETEEADPHAAPVLQDKDQEQQEQDRERDGRSVDAAGTSPGHLMRRRGRRLDFPAGGGDGLTAEGRFVTGRRLRVHESPDTRRGPRQSQSARRCWHCGQRAYPRSGGWAILVSNQ